MLAKAVVEVADSPEKAKHLYEPFVLKQMSPDKDFSYPLHQVDMEAPVHKPVYDILSVPGPNLGAVNTFQPNNSLKMSTI